jgi:hypothetical protein
MHGLQGAGRRIESAGVECRKWLRYEKWSYLARYSPAARRTSTSRTRTAAPWLTIARQSALSIASFVLIRHSPLCCSCRDLMAQAGRTQCCQRFARGAIPRRFTLQTSVVWFKPSLGTVLSSRSRTQQQSRVSEGKIHLWTTKSRFGLCQENQSFKSPPCRSISSTSPSCTCPVASNLESGQTTLRSIARFK